MSLNKNFGQRLTSVSPTESQGRQPCCLQRWPNALPAAVNTNFTKQRNSDKKAFFSVNLIFFPLLYLTQQIEQTRTQK